MDVFLLYGMGVFDLLVSSLIMCVFVSAEDAMFDEEIYLGINDRDLRGKKGIYSSIVLIICTIGCFVSALYCCIRIARKEAVLRNGIRIPGIKLTEEQRRAILEFIFPGSKKLNFREKELCARKTSTSGSPSTPTTIVETAESDNYSMDSFASVVQPSNSVQRLFPLPRLSNLQEGHFDIDLNPIEQSLYEDANSEANIPCCSICLENYDEGEDIVCSKRCRHYFHKECIMPWLLKKTSYFRCPSCRQHMIDIDDLREATSRVFGSHVVILDEIVEVL